MLITLNTTLILFHGVKMTALEAFENHIRACPIRGICPDKFLSKLDGFDDSNPVFRYMLVNSEWESFRLGWIAKENSLKGE